MMCTRCGNETSMQLTFCPDCGCGTGVRQQVFEVIVRQALAGAPWRQICAGPMQVNNIAENDIIEEVERRKRLIDSQFNSKDEGDEHSAGKSASAPPRPTSIADWRLYAKKDSVSLKLDSISKKLKKLLQETLQHTEKEKIVDALLADLEESLEEIVKLESILESIQREMDSQRSFDSEQERTCKPFFPDQTPPGSDKPDDPHRIDW